MTELTLAGPRPAISDVAQDQLAAWLVARGEPAYRASQILSGVHRPHARQFDDLTDLPVGLRAALDAAFRFSTISASHVLEADRAYLSGLWAKFQTSANEEIAVEMARLREAFLDALRARAQT